MTTKIKRKRGRKVMIIIAAFIGVLLSINVIGFILNLTVFKNELQDIKPYGEMIEVDGKYMHVYSMGNGEKTIVLLPGFGVPLPSADFGPLMRKLSNDYTVVVIEYFGVGFSDETDTARTNENYTNEIRTALQKAGFKPPYILMPHSASGIYSEYYATKYPEEVSGIIMLDTTSTARIEKTPKYERFIYSIAKFQQATGMSRLNGRIAAGMMKMENGYTQKERTDYRKFVNHAINNTIVTQSLTFMNNIKELSNLPFPEDIPVLKIIARDTIKSMAKHDKDDGMGYQREHLNRLGENSTYRVVEASHMLHQTKVDEIVRLTNEFLRGHNN